MENFKLKIIEEYKGINEKIDSLRTTIKRGTFKGEELAFHQARLKAMENYSNRLLDTMKFYGIENAPEVYTASEPHVTGLYDNDMIYHMAIKECLCEMFKHAQPSADYNEYLRMYNEGEIKIEGVDEKDRFYNHHYLSMDDYTYILDCILDKYNIRSYWRDHLETAIDYFNYGVPMNKKDDEGFYIHLPDFKSVVHDILVNGYGCGTTTKGDIPQKIKEAVIDRLEKCRDFYNKNRKENDLRITLSLYMATPTCNKDRVIDFWKRNGKDIVIVDHDNEYWDEYYFGEDDEEELNE